MFGLLSSFGLAQLSWSRARELRASEVEHRALALARVLEMRLSEDVAVAHAMSSYFEASEFVSAPDFLSFAWALREPHPEIRAIEWIPWVRSEDLPSLEQLAVEQGISGFQVREKDAEGRFVPAAPREHYCPVTYVDPLKGNQPSIGFDLCSEPMRREMVETARDTGLPSFSDPVSLVQTRGVRDGLLVCDPIFDIRRPTRTLEERRAAFKGCGLVVLVIEDFMDSLGLKTDQDLWYGLRHGGQEGQLLAQRPAKVVPKDPVESVQITIYNESFDIIYSDLKSNNLGLLFNPLALLAVGLALTVLATTFLVSVNRQNDLEDLMQRRLDEAQRLESLGLLAGGIAHDFNNLLVGILGQASRLRAEAASGGRVREIAEQIVVAGERAAELTRLLLAYAGKGRFAVQEVSLNTLAQDVLRMLGTPAGDRPPIQLELGQGLPCVRGEVAQLQQLLMNLLNNALDATRANGGQIWLRTSLDRRTEEVPIVPWMADRLPPGQYLRLEVEDSGVGMDAATLRQIFDPFFTSKQSGHGLGLSAVLGIIRGHGGAVEAVSALGKGTRFSVLLPPVARAAAELERADELSEPSGVEPALTLRPARGRVVLVADDSAEVRELVVEVVLDLGLEVAEAEDGLQAFDLIRAAPERFGLAILDITMPGLSGVALMKRIRELAPGVPVALTSGYSSQSVDLGGQSAPDAFLEKPYRVEKLIKVIRRLLPPEAPPPEDQPPDTDQAQSST